MRDETATARPGLEELTTAIATSKAASDLVNRAQARELATELLENGWTRPTSRNAELSLRDELAATILGAAAGGGQLQTGPVRLAEHLVNDGWTKPEPGEKLIGLADAALLNEVQCAYVRWESLKKKVRESAEVRRDESQRTSDVKSASDEALILAAFADANTPLYFDEAASAAAGHRVTTRAPESWDRWTNAFRSLVEGGYLETLPAGEGEVRRFRITQAGRSLHELDGVDG